MDRGYGSGTVGYQQPWPGPSWWLVQWCRTAVVREPERLKLTIQQQLGWSGDAVVTKLDLQ